MSTREGRGRKAVRESARACGILPVGVVQTATPAAFAALLDRHEADVEWEAELAAQRAEEVRDVWGDG